MSILLAILGVVGGGIAGSALAWALTWRRENRRTEDAYRTPQREAVAGILSAGYEIQLVVQAVSEASELAADWEAGTAPAEAANAAFDKIGDQATRAILGVWLAFNIGRMTIVDAECYEAMGKAYNEFTGLQEALSGVTTAEQNAAELSPLAESLSTYTRKLNEDIFVLVQAAQRNLSPVQPWCNNRERAEVKKRLEAEYFKYPAEFR